MTFIALCGYQKHDAISTIVMSNVVLGTLRPYRRRIAKPAVPSSGLASANRCISALSTSAGVAKRRYVNKKLCTKSGSVIHLASSVSEGQTYFGQAVKTKTKKKKNKKKIKKK
jgi:hypothetical protein